MQKRIILIIAAYIPVAVIRFSSVGKRAEITGITGKVIHVWALDGYITKVIGIMLKGLRAVW